MFIVQNGCRLTCDPRKGVEKHLTRFSPFHRPSPHAGTSWKGGSVTGRDLPVWNCRCPSITLPQLRIFRQRNAVRSKIFDSQMAVTPSSELPLPPFYFSCPDSTYIYVYVCVCMCVYAVELSPRVSTSLSIRLPFLFLFSLNRITGLFFQAPWIEPEAVYSHVMERRLPRDISTLILCECDWIGYCRLSW